MFLLFKGFIRLFNKVLLNNFYFLGFVLMNGDFESKYSFCFVVVYSLGQN